MNDWSLEKILTGIHEDIQRRLETVRATMVHPGTMGDASEGVWIQLFNKYLPARYKADKAHVVDSEDGFSQQMDVVIYDRQYSPFIFHYQDQKIIPAESVYAVFEAKQTLNLNHVRYAQEKISTVRNLHRTSLPIPHAGGTYAPKPLHRIYGGLLTLESDWRPPLGETLAHALAEDSDDGKIDLGCVAAHGFFCYEDESSAYDMHTGGKPATAFLFKLITKLQFSGTVPMIDILKYGRSLL